MVYVSFGLSNHFQLLNFQHSSRMVPTFEEFGHFWWELAPKSSHCCLVESPVQHSCWSLTRTSWMANFSQSSSGGFWCFTKTPKASSCEVSSTNGPLVCCKMSENNKNEIGKVIISGVNSCKLWLQDVLNIVLHLCLRLSMWANVSRWCCYNSCSH